MTSADAEVSTINSANGISGFSWTCTATGSAVCPAVSGSGALNQTIATFPVGGVVTYTVTATVSNTPLASIANTATVVPPAGGSCGTGNTGPCHLMATTDAARDVSQAALISAIKSRKKNASDQPAFFYR